MAERDVPTDELEQLDGDPEPGDEPEVPQDDPDPDGEPEPDPDAEPDGGEPDPEPEPQRIRRSARDRVQDALRDRDAANVARDAANARAAAAEAAAQARDQRDAVAAEAAEDERVMRDLDENGRVQYLLAKKLKQTEVGQQTTQQQLADMRDEAAFARAAAKNPRMAKLLDEVEAAVRRCPPGTKREAVYFILLGKKLHEGALEPVKQQRQQAQRRVDAQRAPGTGAARSNAQPRSGSRAGTLTQRMERDDPLI